MTLPDSFHAACGEPDDTEAKVAAYRAAGRRIVAVQGLGFVGTAVAATIAGARDEAGQPRHFVIGVELPSEDGRRKVQHINAGSSPILSPDAELEALIHLGVRETGNLCATTSERSYGLAD